MTAQRRGPISRSGVCLLLIVLGILACGLFYLLRGQSADTQDPVDVAEEPGPEEEHRSPVLEVPAAGDGKGKGSREPPVATDAESTMGTSSHFRRCRGRRRRSPSSHTRSRWRFVAVADSTDFQ